MKFLLSFLIFFTYCSAYGQSQEVLPPSPCLFYNYQVDSAGVFLGLMPSSSANVVDHKLYRKKEGTNKWKLIRSFQKDVPQIFLDNTLESNVNYNYKWVAEDHLGRQSNDENSRINITAFDSRIFFRPKIALEKSKDGLIVQVQKDIPGDNFRIEIIKATDGNKYRTAKILKEEYSFLDQSNGIKNNKKVKYKARILYKDGKRSKYGVEAQL